MKFLCEGVQKLLPEEMDRQTDTTENITYPHVRVVNMLEYLFFANLILFSQSFNVIISFVHNIVF